MVGNAAERIVAQDALLQVMQRWVQIEQDGTAADGSSEDLEHGPEEDTIRMLSNQTGANDVYFGPIPQAF